MKEYKIENDIPIPGRRYARKYPWDKMVVGDSIRIDFSNRDAGRVIAGRVKQNAYQWGSRQRPPCRFTVRTLKDHVRIWRIE